MNGSRPGGPVVFAYDGSEFAKGAIALAGEELRKSQALVVTVCEPLTAVAFGGAALTPNVMEDVDSGIVEQAERVADEGAELARAQGFDAEPLVQRGVPTWKVIVDLADERNASLIVIGSHGRTGVKAVVLGSVAGAVASHSNRPVLISH